MIKLKLTLNGINGSDLIKGTLALIVFLLGGVGYDFAKDRINGNSQPAYLTIEEIYEIKNHLGDGDVHQTFDEKSNLNTRFSLIETHFSYIRASVDKLTNKVEELSKEIRKQNGKSGGR